MVVKRSVSIHETLDAFARDEVRSGRHVSLSSVVHEGLIALQERRRREQRDRDEEDAFFEMLRERAKGPFLPRAEADARFEEMMERKRREFGLED